jgi:hypothetical protein
MWAFRCSDADRAALAKRVRRIIGSALRRMIGARRLVALFVLLWLVRVLCGCESLKKFRCWHIVSGVVSARHKWDCWIFRGPGHLNDVIYEDQDLETVG